MHVVVDSHVLLGDCDHECLLLTVGLGPRRGERPAKRFDTRCCWGGFAGRAYGSAAVASSCANSYQAQAGCGLSRPTKG